MSGKPTSTKVGHLLAKGLGINLNYRNEAGQDKVQQGESVFSVASADTYIEHEPTSADWIREQVPNTSQIAHYLLSLFPFLTWIGHYNLQWFIGDLIAGVTIGAVVVPQSMAYAGLALLPPEFGLYSAFMGVLIYWFFATSKDITIGPVAVMSTIVGNVITEAQRNLPGTDPWVIAQAMAIIGGSIIFFLGITRLARIVEFIPLVSVCAFITGSSFSIAMQQMPGLLGIPKTIVNNRDAAYLVVIHTLQHLGSARLDAAIGLTALLMLYLIKYGCQLGTKLYPSKAKAFFFTATLRTIFVILLYTLISWLVNRSVPNIHVRTNSKNAHFAILGTVPRGFKHAGAPHITIPIIKSFTNQIPATVIVLLIEHISIAKSFGRINNYVINPSQELIAIGVTNLLGPFLGAYPATGSFSRTAIKSKAGVRTPLAGVITAIVVLIAIYALTAVFFYIPSAALSAVIIHAVLDLITPANTLYQFWRINPIEVFIFLLGVFVTVFVSIEVGIYCTVSVSAALLLWRVLFAKGRIMGRVTVHSVVGDHLIEQGNRQNDPELKSTGKALADKDVSVRNVFLPLDHKDGSNPSLEVKAPYPGIFIYRFSEGYNYPNAGRYLEDLVHHIHQNTRRTDLVHFAKKGDRPWNDPGPRKGREAEVAEAEAHKPTLKAVILDFSSVNNVDVTSVQTLVDVRNQLDRYAAPNTVEWHLTNINSRWSKRALASAGFGYPTPKSEPGSYERWKPVYSVAEIGGDNSPAAQAEARWNRQFSQRTDDEENSIQPTGYGDVLTASGAYSSKRIQVVQGLNRPFFHIDVTSALQSAIASIESSPDSNKAINPSYLKEVGRVKEEERSDASS